MLFQGEAKPIANLSTFQKVARDFRPVLESFAGFLSKGMTGLNAPKGDFIGEIKAADYAAAFQTEFKIVFKVFI